MPDSMRDYLQRDMDCEGLLECFHGLRDLDRDVFQSLVASDDSLTVDDVSERIDRERSTAYRSVQRLMDAGLVEKRQVNYDHGGYYHVYEPAAPDEIADEMQRMLNDWYAKMGQLIGEFRAEYTDAGNAADPADEADPADAVGPAATADVEDTEDREEADDPDETGIADDALTTGADQ